jgi:hypothetical protein
MKYLPRLCNNWLFVHHCGPRTHWMVNWYEVKKIKRCLRRGMHIYFFSASVMSASLSLAAFCKASWASHQESKTWENQSHHFSKDDNWKLTSSSCFAAIWRQHNQLGVSFTLALEISLLTDFLNFANCSCSCWWIYWSMQVFNTLKK